MTVFIQQLAQKFGKWLLLATWFSYSGSFSGSTGQVSGQLRGQQSGNETRSGQATRSKPKIFAP